MKYLIAFVVGLIVGGALVYYLFFGTPKIKLPTGEAVRAPEVSGDAPGTVLLTLDEKFFDTLLASLFRDFSPPTFPLQIGEAKDETNNYFAGFKTPRGFADARKVAFLNIQNSTPQGGNAQAGCPNQVMIVREMKGVNTTVRFVDGKVVSPIAFTGSYLVPVIGQCIDFHGAAKANITLKFDQEKQTLYGQINVEGVDLENAPAFNSVITSYVQNAINSRVNPVEVLRASQLTLNIPVQSSNGTLKAQVKDVRSEIKDNALRLHITYDFSGAKNAPPQS
ncbi:MAG: hypothetical protein NVSMB56_04110 [Pyrinomonadaceae bacterium]